MHFCRAFSRMEKAALLRPQSRCGKASGFLLSGRLSRASGDFCPGSGENFFSREKSFSPLPEPSPLSRKADCRVGFLQFFRKIPTLGLKMSTPRWYFMREMRKIPDFFGSRYGGAASQVPKGRSGKTTQKGNYRGYGY